MKRKPDMTLEEAHKARNTFIYIGLATIMTIIVGSFAMSYLEGLSAVDAAYFSVVSLTTVGFGDISPETTGGKIFVMGYLLVGIGILAAFVNNVLRFAVARRVIKYSQEDGNKSE